ncbi:MAG TPA: hypothetical protein G4O00_08185 [Thermoflexia bacterium]|jgi:Na+-transporting methylmalonyl-CoA/oxaloacetate decarboxylase gamma subunit|nr:hypothetical protein [Thermoflexia bacterium]
MDDPLTISLIISGIGMALLFAALFVLYGLMYLMTAVIKDRPAAAVPVEEEPAEEPDEAKRRAAVIAVALARAERETFAIGAPPEEVSPWWALHLHRQLTNRISPRSGR